MTRAPATLRDTKSERALSVAACNVLRSMLRINGQRGFPATRGDGLMTGFPKQWARITKLAQLPGDITPHTLRHSFASVAGDLQFSVLTIKALIGHRAGHSVTSGYVHAADAVLLAAADAVANETAKRMGEIKLEAAVAPTSVA
jgi:integrase